LSSRPSKAQLTARDLASLATTYNLAAYASEHARIPSLDGDPLGAPFTFTKFPYMMELYADSFPDIVIQKGLQVGASEYAVLRSIHACDRLGCDVMYGFPHTKQIGRFSKTRINAIIRRSHHFRHIVDDFATETKARQSTFLRVIRGRLFHLVGVASDSEIQSESVDIVIRDEFDLMDQSNAALLRKRNYASQRRMYLDLGFPLIDAAGINGRFLESDQREYEVLCLKCGLWQEIQWPRNIDRDRMERVCCSCRASLEQSIRNLRWGRWVPRNPSASRHCHGYHISRLLYPGLDFEDFLQNADNKVREMEFNVYDLGIPYTGRAMRITEALFLSRVDKTLELKDPRLERGVIRGGADVGSVIHVWMEVDEQAHGKIRTRLIDLQTFDGDNKFQQLAEYLLFTRPAAFCIDVSPETTEVMTLVHRFPFVVWGVRFEDFTTRPQEESRIDYDNFVVSVNRTMMLDWSLRDFLDGTLTIPGAALARHKDVKAHFMAPVQIIDTIGRTGTPIKRWTTPEGRPDHWAFARAACVAARNLERWVERDGGHRPPPADTPAIPYAKLYKMLRRR